MILGLFEGGVAMIRKPLIFVFSIGAILLFLPGFVLACACCAEPGLYSIRTGRPSAYELGLVKEFEFGSVAKLYLTEADFAMIKGLDEIEKESGSDEFIRSGGAFDLVNSFTGKLWKIEMRSIGGKTGRINAARSESNGHLQSGHPR